MTSTFRTLLLLLLPVIIFTSCGKDVGIEPELSTKDYLQGTWKETSSICEFYNSSDFKVYERANLVGIIKFNANSTAEASYPGKNTVTGTYTISSAGTTEFLTVKNSTETLIYKILVRTDGNLKLELETKDQEYEDGGVKHTAAKSILISTMVKQ